MDDELQSTMTKKQKSFEFLLSKHITNTISNDGSNDTDNRPIGNAHEMNGILNFKSNLPSFCLKSIISQELIHETREKINEDMNTGKELKEVLKESKRLSSGIIFKAGSVHLGKTVFDIHKENQQEKKKEAIMKVKNDEKEYNDNVAKAKAVFEKKSDLNKMTIRELTIICKPLKRKEDGKMPTKKVELIQKFREWDGRPPPSFSVSEYEETTTNDDNINDDSCSDEVNNIVEL